MIGKHEETLPWGTHRIEYNTTFPILLSMDGEPVAVLNGEGKKVLRNMAGNLTLDVTEPKKPYGFRIQSRQGWKGEKMDDLPPPQPPAPDNYLQMIRQKVRQQMGIIREEPFNRGQTMYELGDIDVFEEDFATSDSGSDTETPPDTQSPDPSDPNSPSDGDPPPETPQAAPAASQPS